MGCSLETAVERRVGTFNATLPRHQRSDTIEYQNGLQNVPSQLCVIRVCYRPVQPVSTSTPRRSYSGSREMGSSKTKCRPNGSVSSIRSCEWAKLKLDNIGEAEIVRYDWASSRALFAVFEQRLSTLLGLALLDAYTVPKNEVGKQATKACACMKTNRKHNNIGSDAMGEVEDIVVETAHYR